MCSICYVCSCVLFEAPPCKVGSPFCMTRMDLVVVDANVIHYATKLLLLHWFIHSFESIQLLLQLKLKMIDMDSMDMSCVIFGCYILMLSQHETTLEKLDNIGVLVGGIARATPTCCASVSVRDTRPSFSYSSPPEEKLRLHELKSKMHGNEWTPRSLIRLFVCSIRSLTHTLVCNWRSQPYTQNHAHTTRLETQQRSFQFFFSCIFHATRASYFLTGPRTKERKTSKRNKFYLSPHFQGCCFYGCIVTSL